MESRFIDIPYIPMQVDLADVMAADGRLLSPKEVIEAKHRIAELGNKDGRYSKKDLGSRFSVSKIGDDYYAIYKGAKHEKLIGKGAFGAVKFVQHLDTGTWAVMKTIRKRENSSDDEHDKSVTHERQSLEDVGHFIGHWQRKSRQHNVTQDEIIMTLAPGTTVSHLIKKRSMPAVKWLDLAIGIVDATQKIHQNGRLHRDIKPANMLADPSINAVTLIDFGLSRKFHTNTREYIGSYAGSPKYMAPEISKHNKDKRSFNEATEVYALGITLAELFHLQIINHHAEREMDAVRQIHNPVLLDELCQLITSMIHKHPEKRPSVGVVMEKLLALRTNELDLVSKVNSLVFLDVSHFMQLTTIQKEGLFEALKNADQVQLCLPPNPWSSEYLMGIRHELQNHGIAVMSHGITLADARDHENTIRQLKECAAEYGARHDVIYTSYFLRTNQSKDYAYDFMLQRSIDSLEITRDHHDIAFRNIDNQITRMRDKNPNDKRLQYLREFRYDLKEGKIKTYRQLFTGLNDLEERLLANESPSFPRKVARAFGLSSTANTAVRQTRSDIINDAHGRKSSIKK